MQYGSVHLPSIDKGGYALPVMRSRSGGYLRLAIYFTLVKKHTPVYNKVRLMH